MTCASCSVTLKAALKKLDGVQNVAVSVGDDSASVTFDPGKVTTKDIVAKIDNVGYKAELNQCKA
jgi:copper chaperone CopZ